MILGVGCTPFWRSFRLIFSASGWDGEVGSRGAPVEASMVKCGNDRE